MQLLHPRDVPQERARQTFRHGVFAPLVMVVALLAPCAMLFVLGEAAAPTVGALPLIISLPLAAIAAGIALVLVLCVQGMIDIVFASMLASNWVMRLADDGVFLQVRSYRNHAFPEDGPTVAFVPFGEIASVREVTESFERDTSDGRTTYRLRWIEFTLDRCDTAPLARLVEHERTRPAPERVFLGVRCRSRHNHVPVIVPKSGVVRVERVGRKMLRALEQHVAVSPRREVDLDAGDQPFDERLRAFIERGETLAAIAFARQARGLSLSEAHELVKRSSGTPA